jgi:hypothetical protein
MTLTHGEDFSFSIHEWPAIDRIIVQRDPKDQLGVGRITFGSHLSIHDIVIPFGSSRIGEEHFSTSLPANLCFTPDVNAGVRFGDVCSGQGTALFFSNYGSWLIESFQLDLGETGIRMAVFQKLGERLISTGRP